MSDLAGPRATRREWVGLAVIALPCLLYSMDLTVLNLAVPHLSADLKPSSSQLLWIVDIYGFLLAGSLITMGTLGDRIGRRRLLLIGAVAFGIASVFAAFSTSAEMLIVARALLGIAAATLAPSTLSLIRNMFLDPRRAHGCDRRLDCQLFRGRRDRPAGRRHPAYLFLVGFRVPRRRPAHGRFAGCSVRCSCPEYRDPEAGRLDIPSAALSLVAVLSVIYCIKRIAEHGPGREASLRHCPRPGRRRGFRAASAEAEDSPDRSQALSLARLQRLIGGERARLLRRVRLVSLHRAISPARAWHGTL